MISTPKGYKKLLFLSKNTIKTKFLNKLPHFILYYYKNIYYLCTEFHAVRALWGSEGVGRHVKN